MDQINPTSYLSKLIKQGYEEVFGSPYRIKGKTFEKTFAPAYFTSQISKLDPVQYPKAPVDFSV